MTRLRGPAEALAKVSRAPDVRGCLLWQGSRCHFGHGQVKFGRSKPLKAHRVAWAFGLDGRTHGALPPRHVAIRHACDVPSCCNPEHLRAGSKADNNEDRFTRGRYFGKLSPASYASVRMLRALGAEQPSIAEWFGVDQSVISRIVNNKTRR